MAYVCMNQVMVIMQFLLSLVTFKVVGYELQVCSNELNRGSWIQACLFHLLWFWHGLCIWGLKLFFYIWLWWFGMISSDDLCEKKRRKQKQWGLKMTENRGDFGIKLIMIGSLKNYDFWWVDRSMFCISNAFWITLIWVLWTKVWRFF